MKSLHNLDYTNNARIIGVLQEKGQNGQLFKISQIIIFLTENHEPWISQKKKGFSKKTLNICKLSSVEKRNIKTYVILLIFMEKGASNFVAD